MRYSVSFLTLAGLLVVLPGSVLAGVDGSKQNHGPVFRLSSCNVAEMALTQKPSGLVVYVQLSPKATSAFADLTQQARGKLLTVLAGEQVFFQATVHGTIGSGRLMSSPRSKKQAIKLRRTIQTSRLASACGESSQILSPNKSLQLTALPAVAGKVPSVRYAHSGGN